MREMRPGKYKFIFSLVSDGIGAFNNTLRAISREAIFDHLEIEKAT